MPRWQGTTTQRGYGAAHQAERRRRLARYKPGDPCAHCGQPMWHRWTTDRRGHRVSAIDLPHLPGKTGYLPGLAHRYCNRRDGQRMTTAILSARTGRGTQEWAAARRR